MWRWAVWHGGLRCGDGGAADAAGCGWHVADLDAVREEEVADGGGNSSSGGALSDFLVECVPPDGEDGGRSRVKGGRLAALHLSLSG